MSDQQWVITPDRNGVWAFEGSDRDGEQVQGAYIVKLPYAVDMYGNDHHVRKYSGDWLFLAEVTYPSEEE